MKFIDSNIIVYAFYNNEHIDKCQEALQEGGITDTFALAEAFHNIEKIIDRKKAQRAIRAVLRLDIKVCNVDLEVIFQAIKRAHKTKLAYYDLIHYICALHTNCTEILSYDKDFNNLDISRSEP
jgi:predicted nucleic acid-binding protein